MAFAPSAFWNSRSITHLANYLSRSLPTNSSDEPRVDGVLLRRRRADRQQRQRARDEAGGAEPQELAVRGQRARRPDGGHSGEPGQPLPPARCGPATLPDAVAGEPARDASERTRDLAAG